MIRKLMLAAAAVVSLASVAPASAMPVTKSLGGEAGTLAETVAWYCNGRGHCVKGPRAGYVVRYGWAPACVGGWYWDGYRCAVRVVAPPVVVAPRVVVAPAPRVVVRPPTVVIRP